MYPLREITVLLEGSFHGVPNLTRYFHLSLQFFIGNDRGSQYRSGFYYFNEEQEKLIRASKEAYEKRLEEVTGKKRPITTEIAAASDYDKYGGVWYFAEPYHQQ